MPYCVATDISTYLSNFTLSVTSEPTLAQVTQMCVDASENIIDPVVRRYTALPVADVEGLKYLKQWTVYCVLASVYHTIEAEPALSIIYDDKCRGMMEAFLDDPGLIVTPRPESVDVALAGGSTRPEVKWLKDEDQW